MKRVLPVLLLATLLLSACGGQSSPPPLGPTATTVELPTSTAQTQAEPTVTSITDTGKPRPGWVTGKATDSQGNPLTEVSISMYGTTNVGSNTYFSAQVDETGHYAQEVPKGGYEITAYVTRQYKDRTYNLWLHPVDNISGTKQSTAEGVVKDFVWRISGPTPRAKKAPKDPGSYYGGIISLGGEGAYRMSYDVGSTAPEFEYPEGSTIELELTPSGPLMDGSQGQVVKRDLDPAKLNGAVVSDVPLGEYTAKAIMVEKDGTASPLHLAMRDPEGSFGDKVEPVDSVSITFLPQSVGDYGLSPVNLFVLP